MRRWYCPRDLLDWPEERLVPETASLAETTQRILTELYPARRHTDGVFHPHPDKQHFVAHFHP